MDRDIHAHHVTQILRNSYVLALFLTFIALLSGCGSGAQTGSVHPLGLTPTLARGLKGTISEFPLLSNTAPEDIAAGPDGNLWFTEFHGNQIGRITPAGIITEFPLSSTGGRFGNEPSGITAGPDVESQLLLPPNGDYIGRIHLFGTGQKN